MNAVFDVIVVGGGHAGTEAAHAAARHGARTLLLTQSIDSIGQMSCNPSIGGIGKGHLVKEVDAFGGVMGWAADRSAIQVKTLNASKGAAVRATRAQIDRPLYRKWVQRCLQQQPLLSLMQQSAEDLLLDGAGKPCGIRTQLGIEIRAAAVVITTGTFLNGLIHVGDRRKSAGRAADEASVGLAEAIKSLGLPMGRLKTGTPPRLDARTIDFGRLEKQPGDEGPLPTFSFMNEGLERPAQLPCWITETGEEAHAIIRAARDRSPLFNGTIQGTGPRYCPSIEDKVYRYPEKGSHQIYLEPEGLDSIEVYPNGISTSLPYDVQVAVVNSMRGLEQARIVRPGYAIEYDYCDPRALHRTLQLKDLPGVFLAGQINGTTGYEEAAAQGLVAGLNAAALALGKTAWEPARDTSYIGVMIDDLTSTGVSEPYRMFTSRAEFRLRLRQDNADERLTPVARGLGVIDDARWVRFERKRDRMAAWHTFAQTHLYDPATATVHTTRARRESAQAAGSAPAAPATERVRVSEMLRRPGFGPAELLAAMRQSPEWASLQPPDSADLQLPAVQGEPAVHAEPAVQGEPALHAEPASQAATLEGKQQSLAMEALEQFVHNLKYEGYLTRQEREVARTNRHGDLVIPPTLDYLRLGQISIEARHRLQAARPGTLAQAARVSGVTPATIALLAVHLRQIELQPAGGAP